VVAQPPYPSYLPSRTFIAALTDIAQEAGKRLQPSEEAEQKAKETEEALGRAAAELERSLAAIPNEKLSEALLAIFRSTGNNAERFQHAVEEWYDDAIERASPAGTSARFT